MLAQQRDGPVEFVKELFGDVAASVLGVVDGASNEFGVGLRMYARRSPDGRACPGQSSFDGDVLHSAGFALRNSPVDFNGPCVRHLRVDREAAEKPLRQVGAVFGRQLEGLRFKVCNAGGHDDTPQAEPGNDMRARAGTAISTGKTAVPRREMP